MLFAVACGTKPASSALPISMPGFFNRVFKRDNARRHADVGDAANAQPASVEKQDPWLRTEVSPAEVQELLRECTHEIKSRGRNALYPNYLQKSEMECSYMCRPFYPISTPPLSPEHGSKCIKNLHTELFQFSYGTIAWCPPSTRTPVDRTFGDTTRAVLLCMR